MDNLPDEALFRLLSANDAHTRLTAASNLVQRGCVAVVPHLLRLLRDPHAGVRGIALIGLSSLGSGEHVGPVAELLADPVWPIRAQAAHALGKLGGPQAQAALLRAMDTEECADVLAWVIMALRDIGTPEAVEAIRGQLSSPNAQLRFEAAFALDKLGDPDAASHLRTLVGDPDLLPHLAEELSEWMERNRDE